MQLRPHLNFNGQCEAAFKFYEKCLGGKISFIMTYGDSPAAAHVPSEYHEKIIHASFSKDGDTLFSGADGWGEHYHKPQGFAVTIETPDPAEADRIYKCLSDKGAIRMAIQETFWARRFAMFTDQFGTPWMINCGKPQT